MKIVKIILLLYTLVNLVSAQGLEETLFNLAGEAAYSYVLPIASGFGSNLNSGWVYEIPDAENKKFFTRVSILAMGSFFGNENRRFEVWGNYRLSVDAIDKILENSGLTISNPEYYKYKTVLTSVPQSVYLSGPTVIGDRNEFLEIYYPGSEIEGTEIQSYRYKVTQVSGFLNDLKFLPLAAVQFTVGSLCGTNFSLRYLPPVELNKIGKFTYWGLGVVHNPAGWTGEPGYVDLGFGFFHQKMTVGNLFSSSATQFGLFVGKNFGKDFIISPLISVNYELSKTIVSYNYEYRDYVYGVPINVTRAIDIDFSGRNRFSLSTGVGFRYKFVGIKFDYKFATTSNTTVTIGFNVY